MQLSLYNSEEIIKAGLIIKEADRTLDNIIDEYKAQIKIAAEIIIENYRQGVQIKKLYKELRYIKSFLEKLIFKIEKSKTIDKIKLIKTINKYLTQL